MKKPSSLLALAAFAGMCALTQNAVAANYFKWDVESNTTSTGPVLGYFSGSTRDCTVSRSGACSMRLNVKGNDGNNQQMGADIDWSPPYNFNLTGSQPIYYRWWMRIMPGFSWGVGHGGHAKTKASRTGNTSGSQGYTGYLMSYGFLIGECGDVGCVLNNGATNTDSNLYVKFNFDNVADGQWHEYIVKVKPNSSASCSIGSNCDAQLEAWVDGVSVGQYNNFKLNNRSDKMVELWGGWMIRPYFQIGGTSSDGGTIYVDDFSTDDTWNSVAGIGGGLPIIGDLVAPLLSSIAASVPTQSGVTISAVTNEPSDFQVEYGLTTNYGQTSAVVSTLATNHSTSLSGLSAGRTYHYRIRSRDAAGNLTVSADKTFTTAAAVANNSGSGECSDSHPAWIWCDDFESGSISTAQGGYYEYDNNAGDFAPATGAGMNGSVGLRARWQAGEVGAGDLKFVFGRNPIGSRGVRSSEDFREIYYRMYVKTQSGWSGNPGKLSRATVFAKSDWSQAMIAHLWSGSANNGTIAIDPVKCVSGSTVACAGYNDFDHMQWLGLKNGVTPMFNSANAGKWQCVEAHVKLNDPGQANGIQEFWVDGNLEARNANLDLVGGYTAYGLNAVFVENYWNEGSSKLQERYIDNFVISTQPIGCGSTAAPKAPVLTVQ